jgi:hypothetical protein
MLPRFRLAICALMRRRLVLAIGAQLAVLAAGCSSNSVIATTAGGSSGPPTAPTAQAREYALVFAQALNAETEGAFSRFVMTRNPGDHVHVLAAPSLGVVASFSIPGGPKNGRAVKLAPSFKKIHDSLGALPQRPVNEGGEQLNLPALASKLRGIRRTKASLSVLVSGSPLYVSHRDGGWNMLFGRVPSEGALALPQSPCPLGPSVSDDFGGAEIHFLTPSIASFSVSQLHWRTIRNIYSSFFTNHKGSLVAFSDDPASVFAKLDGTSQGDPLEAYTFKADPGAFVGMVNLAARSAVIDKLAEKLANDQSVVVLFWRGSKAACDLDLHAALKTDPRREVNFQAKNVPTVGTLYRDITVSNDVQTDPTLYEQYEAIGFIRGVHLSDVHLYVDVYANQSSDNIDAVAFLLTRSTDGVLDFHQRQFRLSKPRGDSGLDSARRESSSNWYRLEFPQD